MPIVTRWGYQAFLHSPSECPGRDAKYGACLFGGQVTLALEELAHLLDEECECPEHGSAHSARIIVYHSYEVVYCAF